MKHLHIRKILFYPILNYIPKRHCLEERRIKGFTFKQTSWNEIIVGVNPKLIIEFLSSCRINESGNYYFSILKNPKPTTKGGFTHRAVVKERNGAKAIKQE